VPISCTAIDLLFLIGVGFNIVSAVGLGGLLTVRHLRRVDDRLRVLLRFNYPSPFFERTPDGYKRVSPFGRVRLREHPQGLRLPFGTDRANVVAYLCMYAAAWAVLDLVIPTFGGEYIRLLRFVAISLLAAQYLGMIIWHATLLAVQELSAPGISEEEPLKFGKVYVMRPRPVEALTIVGTCVALFLSLPYFMVRWALTDKLLPTYLYGLKATLYWVTQLPFVPLKALRRLQLRFRTPRYYFVLLSFAVFLVSSLITAALYFLSKHCLQGS
jgi:hypothetical protein